ncbi:MAG: 16S rRNA (cytidine(1402)-2'-O)-methyltransferase [Candidatus Moranbacteria bacterium]|jgi:16S rRNA (cytidine1402-2'-O)-methyltransferase|nr:16S rRNA (cytidine(1402)-2'-O)-methyltransferase [Candidatus Moranbacteria bacterium]
MLYIVATPIGNLEDITLRAIRIMKEADFVACEDTRVTRKLTAHYEIETPLISYHQHSKLQKIDFIISKLKEGKNIALVTDAGTPGISDPGNILVAEAVKNGIDIATIPGASALAALASVAGIDMQKFIFLGFPPHKKGRETFFKEVIAQKYPAVYYDSVHRVIKNLGLLQELGCEKNVILGRELTKMFEEIARGSIEEILKYFENNPVKVKGEFVIIIYSI